MEKNFRRVRAYPPAASPRRGEGQRDWEIAITGDLTDKQSELLGRLVEVPRRSRGLFYFDSCGGSVYVGLALATVVRLRGLQVTGIVAGECSSAALLPFAACSRRLVTPHSTLLFHAMRWQTEEDVKLEEAAEWTRHFQHLEKDLDELLVKLFGCDPELITGWTNPGRFVSGPEIVEAGLAEQVGLFAGDLWMQISHSAVS